MVRLIGFGCLLAFVAVSRHAIWGEQHPGDTAVLISWYGWSLLAVGFVLSFVRIRVSRGVGCLKRP